MGKRVNFIPLREAVGSDPTVPIFNAIRKAARGEDEVLKPIVIGLWLAHHAHELHSTNYEQYVMMRMQHKADRNHSSCQEDWDELYDVLTDYIDTANRGKKFHDELVDDLCRVVIEYCDVPYHHSLYRKDTVKITKLWFDLAMGIPRKNTPIYDIFATGSF